MLDLKPKKPVWPRPKMYYTARAALDYNQRRKHKSAEESNDDMMYPLPSKQYQFSQLLIKQNEQAVQEELPIRAFNKVMATQYYMQEDFKTAKRPATASTTTRTSTTTPSQHTWNILLTPRTTLDVANQQSEPQQATSTQMLDERPTLFHQRPPPLTSKQQSFARSSLQSQPNKKPSSATANTPIFSIGYNAVYNVP